MKLKGKTGTYTLLQAMTHENALQQVQNVQFEIEHATQMLRRYKVLLRDQGFDPNYYIRELNRLNDAIYTELNRVGNNDISQAVTEELMKERMENQEEEE